MRRLLGAGAGSPLGGAFVVMMSSFQAAGPISVPAISA